MVFKFNFTTIVIIMILELNEVKKIWNDSDPDAHEWILAITKIQQEDAFIDDCFYAPLLKSFPISQSRVLT